MKKNTCIYKGTSFEESTYEHILQASFGGRWQSNTLICQQMQDLFSGVIDNAVADQISNLRSLFNTKNGRGRQPAPIKNVLSLGGKVYDLQPGMQPSLSKGSYELKENPDGPTGVAFLLTDEKQLPEVRARFLRENPTLSLDDSPSPQRSLSQDFLDDPLKLSFTFGGKDFFRGILKSSFNLLGVNDPALASDPAFDALKMLIVEDAGDVDDFARWVSTPEKLPIQPVADIDHTLAVWSRDGVVYGLMQLFGDVPFLLRLAEGASTENFFYGYVVNPRRDTTPAENRDPLIDVDDLPKFTDAPIRQNSQVRDAFQVRLGRICEILLKNSIESEIGQIVDDVFGPCDGRPIDEEMGAQLIEKSRGFIEHVIGTNRPSTNSGQVN